jgi:hypothetical protein
MQEAPLIYTNKRQLQYKDFYLRLVACLIASHIIVVYGETESVFEMLLTKDYYYAVGYSFVIAFILFTIVRQTFIWLDKKFDWMEQPVVRLGLQVFFGLIIPGFLAFMLAASYFRIRAGINILHTSYLRYDFQFILLQLLLINFYYVGYYFYGRWSQAEQVIGNLSKSSISENNGFAKDTFQVSKGSKNLLLPVDEIAYCYREGESNFLRSMTGEDFFISQSLDEVQQVLPENKFFRANRQLVVHRKACKGYDLLTYGKLKAKVYPEFPADIVISQKRAVAFKTWVETKSA